LIACEVDKGLLNEYEQLISNFASYIKWINSQSSQAKYLGKWKSPYIAIMLYGHSSSDSLGPGRSKVLAFWWE
jgi:hypothetical protein